MKTRPSPELFDEDFYRTRYGDDIPAGVDPLDDYLERGWTIGYDPSPKFSTKYYLDHNKDVAEAGFNPLVHYVMYGKSEGRRPAPFFSSLKNNDYRPLLSVIIPVFNHADFLPQRLNSIIAQGYENMEVIILDDASTDNSIDVVEKILSNTEITYSIERNTQNSGAIFRQWEKGLRLARGEIVWICESDDYCDSNFLRELMPLLADESIMLAFGDIQFCDTNGVLIEGLDNYRQLAEPNIWNETLVRPAAEWFSSAFSHSNVIPNVGGCLFRRQNLSAQEWAELAEYSVAGDWYFYLLISRGGRIAFEPAARAYFRQHGTNSSVKAFRSDNYYREHERIAIAITRRWGMRKASLQVLERNVAYQFKRSYVGTENKFANFFNSDRILNAKREEKHILLCMLGFHLGGGELLPIHLANMLVNHGLNVSMLLLQTTDADPRVRAKLDKRVAVYDCGIMDEMGISKFLAKNKIDLVHSHNVAAEVKFFRNSDSDYSIPYLVTLHGSYEFATIGDDLMYRILRGVKRWVYLTERNLDRIKLVPLDPRLFLKIPNAVELSTVSLPFSRQDLGISDEAFVFAIVSRAIKEKGWEQAVSAFERIVSQSSREMHLLFCGTGPEATRLEARYSSKRIHFLGFQPNPHGIYALSDSAILPSRFEGESYPLTLIEALQVGRPAISTDLGACREMIGPPGEQAGILLAPFQDDAKFVAALSAAMLEMSNQQNYEIFRGRAKTLSKAFDPKLMLSAYLELYADMLGVAADSH